jgi:hypothetical protein
LDSEVFPFSKVITPDEVFTRNNVVIVDESIRQNQKRTVIRIESPADLLLIDPQGRATGADPDTGTARAEIPDVFYFGPDEEIGPEYLTIKDLNGAWTLQVRGTANGSYTIVTENIEIGNYHTAETMGIASPASLSTYLVRNPSDGVAFTRVVEIDIKPDSDPNPINPRSNGEIPVAILTTNGFDAATVDPLTVKFGPDGAVEAHARGHIQDADGDGDDDIVLHFRTQETGIQCGDTEVGLTGITVDGQEIEGSDSIQTVGCK